MPPSAQSGEYASRPNLLMLVADDHPAYLMGADGNTLVRTPNLDRLAGEGVRFTRNFCQSPVCSPSRQSMLSGQLPHSSGVSVLNTQMSTDTPTVAKQLRAAGYSTAVIGKMHWNCRPEPPYPGIYGFDLPMADQNAWQMYRDSVAGRTMELRYFGARMPLPEGVPLKPHYRDFVDPTRTWMNAACIPEPCYERDLRGTFLAEKAIEFLKQPRHQPFALWVSFSEPHAPFAFPVEDLGLYRADQFQHPSVAPHDWESVPLVFRELTDEDRCGIAAACYTSVQFLDRNVGRVLRALSLLGLDDNTLVVYTSDHGTLLGHHGRVEKHCLFDEAIRTPLLMRFPGRFAGGRVISALTESVDIPGTVLEFLKAEPLPVDHGRSLAPLLEGRTASHRTDVFSEYLENEEAGLRTERWKFWYCSGKRSRLDGLETDNPTPGRYVRLFDLAADPGEFNNLAAVPSFAPIIAEMKQHLLARFLATHPDVSDLPAGLALEDELDWFLRPRDGHTSGKGPRAFKYGVEPARSIAPSATTIAVAASEFRTQYKGEPQEC